MTDERKELIERWAREAHDAFYRAGRAIPPDWDVIDRFDRERWMATVRGFAALVRADALEEAARVCEQQAGEPECPERAAYCADAIRKLFQAQAADGGPADEYQTPNWGAAGRVHDWRNYVSDELRAMWRTFTPAQQTAIGKNAEEAASREEWD